MFGKSIGSVDISTLSNSGTGYYYANRNDDYTIARIMSDNECVGYITQIYKISNGEKHRAALLFTHRPDKLGFNFHGCDEFYSNCYIDSQDVPKVIDNYKGLITTGSIDVKRACWDFDDNTSKICTNKFELYRMS